MDLEPLVTVAEAASWGFTLDIVALRRASARIRGHLGQQMSGGESTITARGPVFRLPERPVVSVDLVIDEDGAPLDFDVQGSVLTVDHLGLVTVAYSHGYAELPDEVAELVCQVASRLSATDPGSALAQGVQQQTAGSFSVGYGWDAWKAQAGLTQGEKDTLARYWPALPQIISVGGPA